jgi:hypothetical protein
VAVWTNADIAELPIDFAPTRTPPASANSASRLAKPTCHVGDPRRCSPTTDVAEDAADQVALDIEELPVVVFASDPPGEFEPGRSTVAIVLHHSSATSAASATPCGDRADSRPPPFRRAIETVAPSAS